jgi:hypothetical protein
MCFNYFLKCMQYMIEKEAIEYRHYLEVSEARKARKSHTALSASTTSGQVLLSEKKECT